MASSKQVLSYPTLEEGYREELLKEIKFNIRENSSKIFKKYNPSVTYARTQESYFSNREDEKTKWSKRYKRIVRNEKSGFFSDKRKAYRTIGTIYLNSADLVFHGLTDELKNQLEPIDKSKYVTYSEEKKEKIIDNPTKKYLLGTDKSFNLIMKTLGKVTRLRKAVYAKRCINNLVESNKVKQLKEEERERQENELFTTSKKSTFTSSVGSVSKESTSRTFFENDAKNIRQSSIWNDIQNKSVVAKLLEDLQDRKYRKNRFNEDYLKEKRRKYREMKLHNINSLLCAIYNMKQRTLHTKSPLPWKTVKDLLDSDVIIDGLGRPLPSRMSSALNQEKRSSLSYNGSLTVKRSNFSSSSNIRSTQKFKNSESKEKTFSKKDLRTWGELTNNEARKLSRLAFTKVKNRKLEQQSTNCLQHWQKVAEVERSIEKHRDQHKQLGMEAKRLLEISKEKFMQLKIDENQKLINFLNEKEMFQLEKMKHKIDNLKFDRPLDVNLARMRKIANEYTIKLQKNARKPLSWFQDLEKEALAFVGNRNRSINISLEKLRRFCHEEPSLMINGKEKLCLLLMSTPIHILMCQEMIDAIEFVLNRILHGSSELLKTWLRARKLNDISKMMYVVTKTG